MKNFSETDRVWYLSWDLYGKPNIPTASFFYKYSRMVSFLGLVTHEQDAKFKRYKRENLFTPPLSSSPLLCLRGNNGQLFVYP